MCKAPESENCGKYYAEERAINEEMRVWEYEREMIIEISTNELNKKGPRMLARNNTLYMFIKNRYDEMNEETCINNGLFEYSMKIPYNVMTDSFYYKELEDLVVIVMDKY